jgi:hypothetical protein
MKVLLTTGGIVDSHEQHAEHMDVIYHLEDSIRHPGSTRCEASSQ